MNVELVDLVQVERRSVAVVAVRRVVHALWALARAQLPQVEEAAQQASEYLDAVEGVVNRLAEPASPVPEHEVLKVVLGPERSFCGSLHRQVVASIPEVGPLGVVGRRTREALTAAQQARVVFTLDGPATVDELVEVTQAIAHEVLLRADAGAVELLVPRRLAGGGLERVVLLSGHRHVVAEPPETFSPVEEVLDAAIVELVQSRLVVALAESLRAEVQARISAADAARRASDEQLEVLEHARRVLRKEETTREILELVGGQLSEVDGMGLGSGVKGKRG